MASNLRSIAIYLPQFHPIPENDAWWGKGFTEWTNVAKAKPLFKGHYQPHLPADLGFYDLRLPEVRDQQAQLAREYGIYGFCYYHYWFNGRRILERPFKEVFESGKPNFPFMLCWANENWTRVWDGGEKNILLQQNYSEEDDRNHIRTLIPYFKDSRYIKIEGKPVFAVYRSTLLPNAHKTTDIWREEAQKEGLELYICRFESHGYIGKNFIEEGGFDAAIDFQPFGNFFNDFRNKKIHAFANPSLPNRVKNKINRLALKTFKEKEYRLLLEMQHKVWDYKEYVDYVTQQPLPEYKWFPGIAPSWDNYARKKKNYFMFKNASPQAYMKWLKHIVDSYKPKSLEENFIFINAWNEWAEGNHLEPCSKWGLQYLESTKEVLNS